MSATETLSPKPEAMQPNAVTAVINEFPNCKVESLPEYGITLLRGALNPEQASAFQGELKEIMDLTPDVEPKTLAVKRSPHERISQVRYATDLIVGKGFVFISEILRKLRADHDHQVVVNHQEPGGKQVFHADGNGDIFVSEESPLIIVQASDNGFLDYSPGTTIYDSDETAEQNAIPLPVNAGDIIIQTDPDLVHRGRNGSIYDRYNLVIFNLNKPISLEQAIEESKKDLWGAEV